MKYMHGKLERIEGGAALRTDSIEGHVSSLPEVGRNFIMLAEGLTPGSIVRYITTSPVVETRQTDNEFWFSTETGSVYRFLRAEDANG